MEIPGSSTVKFDVKEGEHKHRKRRKVRKQRVEEEELTPDISQLPGVKKIVISEFAQHKIECFVGEHVTGENPWKYVSKDNLDEHLELQHSQAEFDALKQEIRSYPRELILLGYIPHETREYDEFYICVTLSAETIVADVIDKIQQQRDIRLNNSIFKTVRPWKSLGSENSVNDLMLTNSRPLLEVEIESPYPIAAKKMHHRLRLVEDVRDGYIEILSNRITFSNITKKRIDASVQVTPTVATNHAQTILTYPKNAYTQYDYEFRSVENYDDNKIQTYLEDNLDTIDDMMYVNGSINLYTSDYKNLIKSDKCTVDTRKQLLKENISFVDIHTCRGKPITSLSWHLMWSGIVAIAYSNNSFCSYRKAKPNEDEVTEAIFRVNPVLLWSFDDYLNPKLYLETPREVSVVSFCPHDENLLIGGSVSGQIIIWDISNRIVAVEKDAILTIDQQRYRTEMFSLMHWMKRTGDIKVVRSTAVSKLEYSHTAPVTSVRWVSPLREISKSGQIKNIPTEDNRTSLQFMTSSRDGTVLCWDLIIQAGTEQQKSSKKLRRLKERPSGLLTDISPFKDLHRNLTPIFKVNVMAPNSTRNLPLAIVIGQGTPNEYEEVNPNPNRKFKFSDRIYHKPIFVQSKHALANNIFAGSVEGDFFTASWEGFSFNSGEAVNKEACKFDLFVKFHDGPIVAVARSEIYTNLVLTVGGKVFALWILDFKEKPVFWRKSKNRYTHGSWNIWKPDILNLSTDDGYIEMWNIKIRSDHYESRKPVSAGSLIGVFTHPLRMEQNVVGVADYNGAFRLFLVSRYLTQIEKKERHTTYSICLRECDRKTKFMKWQQEWKIKNEVWLAAKMEEKRLVQEEIEQEKKQKQEQEAQQKDIVVSEANKIELLQKAEPGKYEEWANRIWRIKEEQRMNKVLLQKKSLDLDVLTRQQLPLTKIREDAAIKRKKQSGRLNEANKLFENTVAMLFPDAIDRKLPSTPDPYAGGDPTDVKVVHYENYLEITKQAQEVVNKNKYVYNFNWLNLIEQGKKRRKVLDGYYTRESQRTRRQRKQSDVHEQITKTGYISKPIGASKESKIGFTSEDSNRESNISLEL